MQQIMIERGQLFVDLTQQGITACHVCIDASISTLLMNLIRMEVIKFKSNVSV